MLAFELYSMSYLSTSGAADVEERACSCWVTHGAPQTVCGLLGRVIVPWLCVRQRAGCHKGGRDVIVPVLKEFAVYAGSDVT